MKRIIAFLLVLVMTVCLFSACNTEKEPDPQEDPVIKDFGKVFYVSVNGNDANEGTKEAPLATLGGAVAKVREYKQANGLPEGGIKVEFAAGTYKITQQTDLTAEDSGEKGKPIVYAAADGAEVIFDGGISLNPADFKPANDEFKANLLTEEAKANVLEIDLIAAGVGDLEKFVYPVLNWATFPDCVWTNLLYADNEPQNIARWPNGEYYNTTISAEWDGSRTYLSVPSEKAELWSGYNGIHAFGFGNYSYDPYYTESVIADPATSSVGLGARYRYQEDYNTKSFYVFDIPCELDEPGEYYIDTEADKLYYWPKDGFETSEISLSLMTECFAEINDCDYITFDGLTVENLRFQGFRGTGNDITIRNCVFRCIVNNCINLTGDRHIIENNEMAHIGSNGIILIGGDFDTKKDADTKVINNSIHDFGEVFISTISAVSTTGCGFVIAHNEIYDSSHEAIVIMSGNTDVEYNEIYRVCTETADAGAIYSGNRYNSGSTVYRYNYIHDIVGRAGRKAGCAIYIDDTESFRTVYSNIIVNITGSGIALSGGRNITVFNNVLVNTEGMGIDQRGATWYPTYTSYPEGSMWKTVETADITRSVWKYAQPEMLLILEMRTTEELYSLKGISADLLDSPAPPAYANFYGNVGYNNLRNGISERKKYIFNRIRYLVLNNNEDGSNPASAGMAYSAYMFGKVADNLEYTNDAATVFEDPENGNFFLKEDSKVYRDIIGFEKWDYSLIGRQK